MWQRLWCWGIAWGCIVYASTASESFVYPAGMCVDSVCVVEVGGVGLAQVNQAVISGEGVSTVFLGPSKGVISHTKETPVTGVLPDRYRFKVTADKHAELGLRYLRLVSTEGLGEPIRFQLATLPESSEEIGNRAKKGGGEVTSLPCYLNGRIHEKGEDTYGFHAAKGEVLVAFSESQVMLAPRFKPQLVFTDKNGNPFERGHTYGLETAPVRIFEAPQEDDYFLRIASETGGDACVYRLVLGTVPLVTSFTPVTAIEGRSLNVRLNGYNLPQEQVRLFTGGKNSALCLAALIDQAWALPELRFELSGEAKAPGFTATLTPASLNIPVDGSALVRVEVQRYNGFSNEVHVAVSLPPLSIASQGGLIPAHTNACLMTVSTEGVRYPRNVFELSLIAVGMIEGRPVERLVTPVRYEDGSQGSHVISLGSVAAKVTPRLDAMSLKVPKKKPVTLLSKKPVFLNLLSERLVPRLKHACDLIVVSPERGVSVTHVPVKNGGDWVTVKLSVDPSVLKTGESGQLILGCVEREDASRKLLAVTQCVPFSVN